MFEGPLAACGFGVAYADGPHRERNLACVSKTDKRLPEHSPETLVREAFEPSHQCHGWRINLGRALTALALHRGFEVVVCTKHEIARAFAAWGARTNYEIAEVVSRVFMPGSKLPAKRKSWNGETFSMAAFGAGALVATLCHKGNDQVHEEVMRPPIAQTN